MGPKKEIRNSYYFYMVDYQEDQRKRGRNISIKIASEECAASWKTLSAEDKKYYSDMAGAYKKSGSGGAKLTSQGLLVSSVQADFDRMKNEECKMNRDIETTIQNLKMGSTLEDNVFLLVHTNYFCHKPETNFYVPAEIAILAFNLEDGELAHFHRLVEPNSIPTGYRSKAKDISEKYHMIPYPPYCLDDELRALFDPIPENLVAQDMMKFLSRFMKEDGYPPLYTRESTINPCKYILKEFSRQADVYDDPIKVYSIEKLLFQLKNRCAEVGMEQDKRFPVISNAIDEFDKDRNCYSVDLGCEFHNTAEICAERFHYCSLSYVRRFLYTITDHCCGLLGIEMIPKKHYFSRPATKMNSILNSTLTSRVQSRQSSFPPSRQSQEKGYRLKQGDKSDLSSALETASASDDSDEDCFQFVRPSGRRHRKSQSSVKYDDPQPSGRGRGATIYKN